MAILTAIDRHPVVVLIVLGGLSGVAGCFQLGLNFGEAPGLGLYSMLTGLWFGAVVASAVWRWGNPSLGAAAAALVGTWIGWEAAVNLAIQLDTRWLKQVIAAEQSRLLAAGVAAGALGAVLTWAGVAASVWKMRSSAQAAAFGATGAGFGALLSVTHSYDHPAILLVPWQAAIAALLGYWLTTARPAGHVSSAP